MKKKKAIEGKGKNVLTPNDLICGMSKKEFDKLETIIKESERSFIPKGLALEDIRTKYGFLNAAESYHSFDTYCEHRWGMARKYQYQIINAALTAIEVEKKYKGVEVPGIGIGTQLHRLRGEDGNLDWAKVEEVLKATPTLKT